MTALAFGLVLVALVYAIGPISGCHINPAVTIGRSFTDTFSGIAPSSVPLFIVFQIVGAIAGALLTEYFYPRRGVTPEPLDLPAAVHQPLPPREDQS